MKKIILTLVLCMFSSLIFVGCNEPQTSNTNEAIVETKSQENDSLEEKNIEAPTTQKTTVEETTTSNSSAMYKFTCSGCHKSYDDRLNYECYVENNVCRNCLDTLGSSDSTSQYEFTCSGCGKKYSDKKNYDCWLDNNICCDCLEHLWD